VYHRVHFHGRCMLHYIHESCCCAGSPRRYRCLRLTPLRLNVLPIFLCERECAESTLEHVHWSFRVQCRLHWSASLDGIWHDRKGNEASLAKWRRIAEQMKNKGDPRYMLIGSSGLKTLGTCDDSCLQKMRRQKN
jgi:hypothetical protein